MLSTVKSCQLFVFLFIAGQCSGEVLKSAEELAMSQRDVEDAPTTTLTDERMYDCSESGVAGQVILCNSQLLSTVMFEEMEARTRCSISRRHLRCIKQLMNRCRGAREQKATIYDTHKQEMVERCETNSRRCPFDVIEGDTSILEYCVGQGDTTIRQVGSPEYCRNLAALPRCLRSTKNKCKSRGFGSKDIRTALEYAGTAITRHCENDVETRSVLSEIQDLAIEERSDPIGQPIDDVMDTWATR